MKKLIQNINKNYNNNNNNTNNKVTLGNKT